MSNSNGDRPTTFSVIIPTYNRPTRLEQLLGSILRSSQPKPLEVIICDDGSTPTTQETVQRFAASLPIKYYFQDDCGYRAGAARNMGIRAAAGDLLVFLDDDLLLPADFFEAHIREQQQRANAVCLGRRKRLHANYTSADNAKLLELLGRAEADDREDRFAAGLGSCLAPWKLLYSCNFSLKRTNPEAYFR